MSFDCPTVRVVSEAPGGYTVINASDFDSAVHVKWEAPAVLPPPPLAPVSK